MINKTKAAGSNQTALKGPHYKSNNKTSYKANQSMNHSDKAIDSFHSIEPSFNKTSHITIPKTLKNKEEIVEVRVVIDKLEWIYKPSSGHFSAMLIEFEQIPECYGGQYKTKKKIGFNGKSYITHECKVPLGGKSSLTMYTGKLKGGAYYLKLMINPSKMSKESWIRFHEYLATIFDYGYHDLYNIARVCYIEFAADFNGVKFEDIFVLDTRVTKYYDGYINSGTVYLGVRKGSRQIAVYDKKRQLLKFKINHPDVVTRIEARLCPQNLPLSELGSITNPFASVIVSPQPQLEALTGNKQGERFITSAFGLKGLICSKAKLLLTYFVLTSPYRSKQIARTLEENQCKWWNPEKIWIKALEALSALNPPLYYY